MKKQPPPPISEEISGKRHTMTLPVDLSLRLQQAVSDERARRTREGIAGKVTDSTILIPLLEKALPKLR